MSGEQMPDQRRAARTAEVAAEILESGGAGFGDVGGLTPDQILQRIQAAAAGTAALEQVLENPQGDAN